MHGRIDVSRRAVNEFHVITTPEFELSFYNDNSLDENQSCFAERKLVSPRGKILDFGEIDQFVTDVHMSRVA